LRSLQEIHRILWRRPRPKLGCGAKERRKKICSMHGEYEQVLKERDQLEDLSAYGRIILERILK
jgi:hypothetical protein